MNQPIRVFIIDDNRLFTEALTTFLDAKEEIVLVGSTPNPDEILEKAQSTEIDVVLINATIEEADAAQVIQKIKEELPEVRVIALGLSQGEDNNLKFIEAGASGYVFKERSIAELLRTIELVHSRQAPCSPRMAAAVFARVSELSKELSQGEVLQQVELTRREKEILHLVAKGLSNKEIAKYLSITLYTVKNHVHNILEKLQVHSRQEAMRRVYETEHLRAISSVDCSPDTTSSSTVRQDRGSRENKSFFRAFLNRKNY